MTPGFPRLLGDVGGTHARWAWQAGPGEPLQRYATYPCAAFESIRAVIERYLHEQRLGRPAGLAFGIASAAALDGDKVAMTNHSWEFSIAALREGLGVARCLVLNDFEAIAGGLSALTAADCRRIGADDAAAAPDAPVAVLGPGSGLGVAGAVPASGGRFTTISGQGGHVTLAAANAREAAVLEQLRQRFGHASAERALSGPGLVNLYRAVCTIDTLACEPDLQPADVSARALAESDPACVEALALFVGFLGSVAGNLALTLGARGGVFVAGGIVPRLGSGFDAAAFRCRFEDKGRFRGYLQRIPTSLILAPTAALHGAAHALDALDAQQVDPAAAG